AGACADAEQHLRTYQRLDGVPEALELEQTLLRVQGGDVVHSEGYLLSNVRQGHPDAVLILEALSKGYMQTYRLPQAASSLTLWRGGEPDNTRALLWRGEVAAGRRVPAEAMRAYRRVLELDPGRDDARLRLAELLVHAHQAAEAVEHMEQLYQRQPNNT